MLFYCSQMRWMVTVMRALSARIIVHPSYAIEAEAGAGFELRASHGGWERAFVALGVST